MTMQGDTVLTREKYEADKSDAQDRLAAERAAHGEDAHASVLGDKAAGKRLPERLAKIDAIRDEITNLSAAWEYALPMVEERERQQAEERKRATRDSTMAEMHAAMAEASRQAQQAEQALAALSTAAVSCVEAFERARRLAISAAPLDTADLLERVVMHPDAAVFSVIADRLSAAGILVGRTLTASERRGDIRTTFSEIEQRFMSVASRI